MDYQRFIERLPELYENWGRDSLKPKSDRFQAVRDRVEGMTTVNVMQLLNFAVECMEPNEVYCEIGTYQGTTLIGALLNHPEKMAYAVDNFSEYDVEGQNLEKLIDNLANFNLEDRVYFCNQDFEEFWLDYRDLESEDKIGVYFYDGAHDYRSNFMGLLLSRPFLSSKALIVIDDSNWSTVRQAVADFIATNPECRILLDLQTPVARHQTFWNGIYILSWNADIRERYPKSTLEQMRQQPVIEAIYNLQLLEQKGEALGTILQEAVLLQQQKDFGSAERKYKECLLWRSKDVEVWLRLGTLYYESSRYKEAITALVRAIELDSSKATSHYNLGLALEQMGNSHQAKIAYENAIAIEPQYVDAYNKLGNLLTQSGELEQAEATYRQAIAQSADDGNPANPKLFDIYLNLGNVLMSQNQVEKAIEAYQIALTLQPDNPDISRKLEVAFEAKKNPAQNLLNLGNKFYEQKQYSRAIDNYREFLQIQAGDAEMYLALSECLFKTGKGEEGINTLKLGISINPTAAKLHFYLIMNLLITGRNEELLSSTETASSLVPNDYALKFVNKLIVPMVYNSPEEISYYRQRFARGLQELSEEISLETEENKIEAEGGISSITNFYLVYQAGNDLEFQRKYGKLVHQIMAAKYPQWIQALSMPPLKSNSKIRVGYLSNYLSSYSGTLWLVGWLRHCDRQKFEIYCYHMGKVTDHITEQFQKYSDVFHHIPGNLEAVCKQVIDDRLHILVFPDIGMDPATMKIAGLRLAPVQCTAWGHPVTSGLLTIDYYLSSELMEPDNGQEHYSETLIRLPKIGVSYPKPDVPQLTKTRKDFQLRDNAVVYFCCQAPFKYLPQHDCIFTEIARRIPQAQFVFIRANPIEQRLKRAFAAVGLNSEDYCRFLPSQARRDYLMLNLLSDVYLDSLGFTGGNTTLDAIACNLPVVTCPGEFMRGRLSYGMLRMIGMTETIADNEAEYIEIAVRLALDSDWRQQIVQYLAAHHDSLYNDTTCVVELEAFYKQVVQEGSAAV